MVLVFLACVLNVQRTENEGNEQMSGWVENDLGVHVPVGMGAYYWKWKWNVRVKKWCAKDDDLSLLVGAIFIFLAKFHI